jgi:serine/threonine protein kinase
MNDPCPTLDKLQQLLEETLPEDDRRAIEPHLKACADCRAVLDRLTDHTTLPWVAVSAAGSAPCPDSALATLRYRLVRSHAHGGLGEVYEVRDEQFDRCLALKVLMEEHCADPDRRRRFLEEARLTAELKHPGIVPIHAMVQTSDGRPGYLMPFIRGETLHEAIRRFHETDRAGRDPGQSSLALRQLLSRFIAVCNTVAYAHSQKVLHRDVKPSNIMLGPYGETLLLDWGLAKRFGADTAAPMHEEAEDAPEAAALMSQARGTPGFMSPEQTAGSGATVGPSSDIYNLGATLYYLLTGQTPFSSRSEGFVHKVQAGEFPRPRTINPHIHPDLEAVCLKAMALRPGDRYGEAAALAADVDNWLAGTPGSARREPLLQRAWRGVKTHRVKASVIAAAVLVGLAASAVYTPFLQAAYTREFNARVLEQEQRSVAEAQRARADNNLQQSLLVLEYFLTRARSDPRPTPTTTVELRDYYLPRLIGFYKQLLTDQDDPNPEARHLVGRAYHGLGVCYTLMGDRPQAERHFLTAQAVQEKLAAEPGDPARQTRFAADLAVTRIDLALLYKDWGRRQDAAAVERKVASSYHSFPNRFHAFQFAVRVTMRFEALGYFHESLLWQGKVIDALEAVLREDSRRSAVRNVLAECLRVRALLWSRQQRYALALHDWQRRSELTDAPLPLFDRVYRAVSLAKQGEHLRATAEAESLCGKAGMTGENLYNLALVQAASASLVGLDPRLPPAERDERARRYAKGAVTCLRKSHAAGYFQTPGVIETFQKEAAFHPLRPREDFKHFLAELEKPRK